MDDPAPERFFEEGREIFRERFPGRLSERDRIIEGVLEALRAEGCDPDPFFDRLCLDEIISNAIVHGNKEDPAKTVTVRVFCDGKRWGFEITDQGAGFDWKAAEARYRKPPGPTEESGRGLFLVHAAGYRILFLEGGRCVRVVREPKKDRRGDGGEPPE